MSPIIASMFLKRLFYLLFKIAILIFFFFKKEKTCEDFGLKAYRIRRGDSFYKIGDENVEKMNRIMSMYPDIDPEQLPVGKMICIPEADPCQEGFSKYKIKRGDTFFSISKHNSEVMEKIMSLVPEIDPSSLPVGRSICVPSSLPKSRKETKKTKKHKIVEAIETTEANQIQE